MIQPKGDEVRCRLVVQDYTRERELEDDLTFASTPLLLSLKILLLFAIQKGYTIIFGDVSTAFLHAELKSGDVIHVRPPKEYYGWTNLVWELLSPLYGLRTSPKDWQDYIAEVLPILGGRRLKNEPNVYVFNYDEGIRHGVRRRSGDTRRQPGSTLRKDREESTYSRKPAS